MMTMNKLDLAASRRHPAGVIDQRQQHLRQPVAVAAYPEIGALFTAHPDGDGVSRERQSARWAEEW